MTNDNNDKSVDVFGIKPLAQSVDTVTKGGVDAASALLSRICLPAAEEFGLLLRDKVSGWRQKNAIEIARKAQVLLDEHIKDIKVHSHPRLVFATLEHGSWADDDLMQKLWAGLLVSSCTPEGNDESNLMFITLMSQLTSSQAKIIEHICSSAKVHVTKGGFINSDSLEMSAAELMAISGHSDLQRLDRELDHLRALELIINGFDPSRDMADVTPFALALHFYARAKGYVGCPIAFYDAKPLEVDY